MENCPTLNKVKIKHKINTHPSFFVVLKVVVLIGLSFTAQQPVIPLYIISSVMNGMLMLNYSRIEGIRAQTYVKKSAIGSLVPNPDRLGYFKTTI